MLGTALEIRRKVNGEVSAEVARCIEDLGRIFYDRGEYGPGCRAGGFGRAEVG